MTPEELESLIAEVQHRQSELNDVEVKSARGGTPKRLYEAPSAVANCPGGASEMEPALRPVFTVEDIDGKTVVAVEIADIPTAQRPCYYKPAGLQKGAYIRVGNPNRQITCYYI